MKLDMHIHSAYSRDAGNGPPKEVLKRCRAAGLDGLCISDHNAIAGSLEAYSLAKEHGLVVVRGVEVSTLCGHVLAYGVGELVPRSLSVEETVERVHALGGVAVAAHPRRFPSGVGLEVAGTVAFDGIEVLNGGNPRSSNRRAEAVAVRRGLARTGGSDAHKPHEIGRAYTVVEGAQSEGDVIEAIAKGSTSAGGRSRTASEGIVYSAEILLEWARGGFKRL